jgi:hypothetical protein
VSSALGNTSAVLVIDSADPGVGSTVPASGSFTRVLVNLSGTGSGNGYGSVSLQIPNNAALVGQTFYGRWYVSDAGAVNGFAVSQAFRFTVFGSASAPNSKHTLILTATAKPTFRSFDPLRERGISRTVPTTV